MNIKGYCCTNLDGFDCSGIKSFVDVPRKGDRFIYYKGRNAYQDGWNAYLFPITKIRHYETIYKREHKR